MKRDLLFKIVPFVFYLLLAGCATTEGTRKVESVEKGESKKTESHVERFRYMEFRGARL